MSKATEDFIARSKARMTAAKATPAHTPGKWAHDTMIAGRDARILELSAENTRLRTALQNALNVLAGIATGDLATVRKDSPAIAQARAALGGQA